ncbi:unnamed protein product, partial [Medioppia subpectinata]
MYGLNDRSNERNAKISYTREERRSLSNSHSSLDSCGADHSCRNNLKHLLHSYRFHLLIVGLVIVDCIVVVIELMIDLQIYQTEVVKTNSNHNINESHKTAHTIAEVRYKQSF